MIILEDTPIPSHLFLRGKIVSSQIDVNVTLLHWGGGGVLIIKSHINIILSNNATIQTKTIQI